MFHYSRHFQLIRCGLVIVAGSLTLFLAPRLSGAETMSMEAFRAKFQEETGKAWESITPEERRDYIQAHLKTEKKKIQGKRTHLATAPSDKSSNLKRTVNVDARKKFFLEYQKEWEAATEEEQEDFLKKYKKERESEANLLERKKTSLKKKLQQIERDRKKTIAAKEKKKLLEEREKKMKAREEKKKRDTEKKLLKQKLKRLKALQRQIRR